MNYQEKNYNSYLGCCPIGSKLLSTNVPNMGLLLGSDAMVDGPRVKAT